MNFHSAKAHLKLSRDLLVRYTFHEEVENFELPIITPTLSSHKASMIQPFFSTSSCSVKAAAPFITSAHWSALGGHNRFAEGLCPSSEMWREEPPTPGIFPQAA